MLARDTRDRTANGESGQFGGVAFNGKARDCLSRHFNCMAGALIDARGLATLTPEEETENPGEVRSQRRLCLPSVDE